MSVTLNDVITALKQLGGEAQAFEIKDQITKNFGGVPKSYKNKTSFRETIKVILQENSTGEQKHFDWDKAVFKKVGFGRGSRYILIDFNEPINNTAVQQEIQNLLDSLEVSDAIQNQFNPNNITDAREKTIASIVQRRGQAIFRDELIKAYDGKCTISGCDVLEALEASHIIPYKGLETNKIPNGVLLRADIHTLFDLRLLTIDEEKFSVIISQKLKNTYYSQYEGKIINLPKKLEFYPSKEALNKHRSESNL